MNLFIHQVIAAVLHLTRTCPKCKRDQVVPKDKRHEQVQCKFCGANIPPSK